jgi:adenosylcobinamide-GDP ribazoletransferase
VKAALRAAVAAVAFLTRVPVGRMVAVDARDVGRGAVLFPVVGALVGGTAGLVADLAAERLPELVAGALAVTVAALITGALHLDAVADTADALGATSRERALEIMRDHAVGAFGATALVLVCLLDAAALGALAESGDAALVGVAAGAAGRAAMLPLAFALAYARPGEGQGRALDGVGLAATALAIGLALLLALPAGAAGLWGAAAAAGAALAVGLVARSRFGGFTGDVLGAAAKLAETAALLAAVAVLAGTQS